MEGHEAVYINAGFLGLRSAKLLVSSVAIAQCPGAMDIDVEL